MSDAAVSKSIFSSLQALQTAKLNMIYCHGPDRETPIAAQAAAVDKHYRDGVFDHFGVSNLDAETLQEWIRVADEKGYVKPSIYQGQYNLLCRAWEDKLFPLLRQHGIQFSAFSPLAGRFLTGKLTFAPHEPSESLRGTRFDLAEDNLLGKAFRCWYDKASMHLAIKRLRDDCEKEGISMTDASLRWIAYHSGLQSDDEIVFGATNPSQIASLAKAMADGPLSSSLASSLGGLWKLCEEDAKTIIEY